MPALRSRALAPSLAALSLAALSLAALSLATLCLGQASALARHGAAARPLAGHTAAAAVIAAAIADPARPAKDRALDAQRQPAALLAAAGIHPGQTVVDFFPGAYFDRLFAHIVGPRGRVILFVPRELTGDDLKDVPKAGEHPYAPNVSVIYGAANQFAVPAPADIVWIRQNYHDLYDKFMAPTDVPTVNRAIFKALKPGGRLVIIDHSAVAGSGLAATETLHRIDEARVKADLAAAGFTLVGHSDALGNPADPRDTLVFDKAIRGHTDQFVLVFKKPG